MIYKNYLSSIESLSYVEWSLHQPNVNTWEWSGETDVVEFIRIAQEEDLLVLLRPGPYICAERNLVKYFCI